MKLHFSKSFGRPWAKLLLFLAGLLLSPLAVMATDPIYVNYGTINGAPPQVDATTFVNYGIWTNINTGNQPYQTAHTRGNDRTYKIQGQKVLDASCDNNRRNHSIAVYYYTA